MIRRGHAPLPLLGFAAAAATLAFVADHPAMLAAIAAGALALYLTAPRRSRILLIAGLTIGIGALLLNPFVQANGDLILLDGPRIPLFDLQVTAEELVAGVAIALRAFAVTVILSATLGHCDPDRVLTLAARLMPRSALTASIAARMLPMLERDSRSILDAARLRGRSPLAGSPLARARAGAALAMPLVGSSLERSLDVAEAMAARGYGAGPRTRIPEAPWTARERLVGALTVAVAVAAGLAVAGRIGAFTFYPVLDPMTAAGELTAAGLVAGLLAAGAAALRA